jgi:phospholipase/carboxylesterase
MFDDAVTAVARFVKSLPALYNADLDRVVLKGFSQGAAACFAVALRRPGLVKGIASLVGFMPEGVANLQSPVSSLQSPLSNLPVFMAAGKNDPTIPLAKARETAEILRAAEADLTYHEYDTGHKLNAQGTRDLTAWWSERG